MIERQHGLMTLLCDGCDDPLGREFEPDEFPVMIAHAKTEGWKIRPDGQGGYSHHCPGCQDDPVTAAKALLGL